jgi:hypothetical protein
MSSQFQALYLDGVSSVAIVSQISVTVTVYNTGKKCDKHSRVSNSLAVQARKFGTSSNLPYYCF